MASAEARRTASSLDDALSPATAQALTVHVPLARIDAEVVAGHAAALATAGISAPAGVLRGRVAAEIVGRFGLDARADTAAGPPEQIGLATRYHDWWREAEVGSVRGDGRAVLLSDAVVRDAGGRVIGLEEQQLKGVPTGLRPVAVGDDDAHGNGREQLRVALKDALFKDYLGRSGIRTNGWVAVLKTEHAFTEGEHTETGGLLVRSGNFLRLAHLNYLRDDRPALREAVDQVNSLVSVELGRPRPLSLGGLYAVLVSRKAEELAALYWARVFHQSTTYDNIGLFEVVDHGSMGTVDRAHPKTWSGTSPGFTTEGAAVLRDLYAGELLDLLKAAATDAERAELPSRARATQLVQAKLDEHMAEGALAHLGLDPDDVAAVGRHHRAKVQVLLRTLRAVGEEPERGASYALGAAGTVVQDPARYDLFGALSVLAELHGSGLASDAQVRRLVSALAPLSPDEARDGAAARRLLAAAGPVLDAALAGQQGPVRAAKLGLIAAEAQRVNTPVVALDRRTVLAQTTQLALGLADGQLDAARVQAELLALVRAQVRTGPDSPPAIAVQLRRGQLPPREEAFLMIKGETENGVRLEEWSDGCDDGVRLTVLSNPLELPDPWRYRLRVVWPDGRQQVHEPTRVDGDAALFPQPPDVIRRGAQLTFFDADDPTRRWDNGGLGFGRGWQLALDSPLVRAELARYAHRHGRQRSDTSDAARKAVSGHGAVRPVQRTTPKVLTRLRTPLDVRQAYSPPRPPGR